MNTILDQNKGKIQLRKQYKDKTRYQSMNIEGKKYEKSLYSTELKIKIKHSGQQTNN